MPHTPNYDTAVKKILDQLVPGERVCAFTGEKWNMTDEEISWYKKFNVPPSKASPHARWVNHGLWYVGYQYWYQTHPETGKPFICTIHPATGLKALPDKEWFAKDFIDRGRGYDNSCLFFEQLRGLQLSVPLPANRNIIEPINSVAFVSQGDEDSYFVGACKSKRTLYAHLSQEVEDSAEIFYSFSIQNSFNIVHSQRIFNCKYIRESFDCLNSCFLFDCRNCENCFAATNKRNKKYLWFNEQLNKEEWEKRYAEIDLGSRRNLQDWLNQFYQLITEQGIWPENFNDQASDSTGEYLTKTSKLRDCYMCDASSANQFSCNFSLGNSENNVSSGYPVFGNNQYYSVTCSHSADTKFSFLAIRSTGMEYSFLCYNCEFCFGCVGLQRKKFCILNKQYTEKEYWKLVDEIKVKMLECHEYGEFFPTKYSPSFYADSGSCWFGATAADHRGFGVLEFDPESHGAIAKELSAVDKITDLKEVPDHINDLDDVWINRPLIDQNLKRRFAMIKPEIEFYRRMRLAPPNKHFIQRVRDLWWQTNQGKFVSDNCASCRKEIIVATNAGHAKRKIYCHSCYLKYLEENN